MLALSGCYLSHTIEPEPDAGEELETCEPGTQVLVFTGECVALEVASGDQAACEGFVPPSEPGTGVAVTGRGRPAEVINRSGASMRWTLEVIAVGECAPGLCYEYYLSGREPCACDLGGSASNEPPRGGSHSSTAGPGERVRVLLGGPDARYRLSACP